MRRRHVLIIAFIFGLAGVMIAVFFPRIGDFAATSTLPDRQAGLITAFAAQERAGFERPSGDWVLRLPQDHGPHLRAQAELWQFSAHLSGPDMAPMTVQFSVLRQGVIPPDDTKDAAIWEMRDLYRAHVIASHQSGAPAHAEERIARGFAGLTGYDKHLHELRLEDWALRFADGAGPWQLSAKVGGADIALEVTPQKQPLPISAPDAPFRGYAFTRLVVTGTITTNTGALPVTGLAAFDHVWGELPVPGSAPVLSDRLLLQFETGADLVLITSRRRDGQGRPTLDAALIGPDGSASQIDTTRAELEFLRIWEGETGNWPVEWQIALDDTLTLKIVPVLDAQEYPFLTPVWSGMVMAEGVLQGERVTGTGLLQLAGGI
jgi:predicted secreted hydrolase